MTEGPFFSVIDTRANDNVKLVSLQIFEKKNKAVNCSKDLYFSYC